METSTIAYGSHNIATSCSFSFREARKYPFNVQVLPATLFNFNVVISLELRDILFEMKVKICSIILLIFILKLIYIQDASQNVTSSGYFVVSRSIENFIEEGRVWQVSGQTFLFRRTEETFEK